MIMPAFLALALFLAAVTPSRDRERREGLILIAIGLVLAFSAGGFLPEPSRTAAAAMIWVVIGAFIGSKGSKHTTISSILLVSAGLIVIPVRIMGAVYEIGQPFLVVSDTLGCAAILVLGQSGITRLGRGVSNIYRYFGSRVLGDSFHRDPISKKTD